jgi:hypothetical protein
VPVKLLLYNPSDYARRGHVVTQWGPIEARLKREGIDPEQIRIFDESKRSLRFQIDRPVPHNGSRDALLVTLSDDVPSGYDCHYSIPTGYVTIDSSAPDFSGVEDAKVVVVGTKGHEDAVILSNNRLQVRFNLAAAAEGNEGNWYAGSATGVELEGRVIKEILDPGPNFWNHNPEKRCMQLDFVDVSYPAWSEFPRQRFHVYDQPYKLISVSTGPVRVSVTLASAPFYYRYRDPYSGLNRALRTSVYRVISLFAEADYIMEELFVTAPLEGNEGLKQPVDLYFAAQFFSSMCFVRPHLSRFEGIPDWFAISNLSRPFVSYGFCTDMHVDFVSSPHPDYPLTEGKLHAISWQIPRSYSIKCLHLFSRYEPSIDQYDGGEFASFESRKNGEAKSHFEHRAGEAWYELIFKPLRAKVEEAANA